MPIKNWVIRLFSATFLLQMAMSKRLWLDEGRLFPKVPLLELPDSLAQFGSFGLISGLIILFLKPTNRFALRLCVVGGLIAVLFDMHRLQVWTYFYLLFFSALIFAATGFSKDEDTDEVWFPRMLLWMLAGFYLWSGLNKLNVWYAASEFPWFVGVMGKSIKSLAHERIFSYSTAIVEALAGLSLLFPRFRSLGLFFLAGMHLVIAFLLSPFGHNWNAVVIPWNLALVGVLILLWIHFRKNTKLPPTSAEPKVAFLWNFPIVLGFWLLPFLGFLGIFEKPLSWFLYTGMQTEGTLTWKEGENEPSVSQFPASGLAYSRLGDKRLQLDDWAFAELNVPPYNSPWVLRRTAKKACSVYLSNTEQAGVLILTVKRWTRSETHTEFMECGK